MIKTEIERNGINEETWHKLAKLLGRGCPPSIKSHYYEKLNGDNYYSGLWNLSEDALILEHLFKGKKDASVEDILAIRRNHLKAVAEDLHRLIDNVTGRWSRTLKPILLSSHHGILHLNWKESFAKYVIEKKIDSMQDMDWKDAVKHFPCQTTDSLKLFIQGCTYNKMAQDKSLSLFEAMELCLHNIKMNSDTQKKRDYREKVVQLYNEIRNS